jgi:hypothetical protein
MKNSKKLEGSRLSLKSEQLKVLGAEELQDVAGGATAPPCKMSCLYTRAN